MPNFTVLPSIDLRGGRVVRLLRGDAAAEKMYSENPVAVARGFKEQGARWIHVVDLDGAFAGEPRQLDLVTRIRESIPGVNVQLGGGMRSPEHWRAALATGVNRIVLGTAAVEQPALVEALAMAHPGRIQIAVDVRNGVVATKGWTEGSGRKPEDLASEMASWGVDSLLVTDVSRDGAMEGPNTALAAALAKASGLPVYVSGGVRSSEDITRLREHSESGIAGVIVGRAIYEGKIRLAEIL